MLTLADLGVLRGRRGDAGRHGRREPHPDLLRLPGHGRDARRSGRPGCGPPATRGSGSARCSTRRGPPTGSPTRAAASSPSTASRRPGPGTPASRRRSPAPRCPDRTRPARVACPRCGSADTEEISRFAATACKALWRCRACRSRSSTSRRSDGRPEDRRPAPDRPRAAVFGSRPPSRPFHALRVAAVEPLCADAAAPSPSRSPTELAEEFAFRARPVAHLRREIDGRDERRSYSICSPAGTAPRIGVRVVPGGLFSSWLVHDVRPGDTVEVMGPAGCFTPDLDRPRPPRADRRRAPASRRWCPSPRPSSPPTTGRTRHPPLRQPAHRHGDVRRRTGRPEGPVPGPLPARPRPVPRAARGRAALRPPRHRAAHRAARTPWSTSGTSTTGGCAARTAWCATPSALLAGLGVPADRVHQELFHADEEPPATPATDRDDATGRGPDERGHRDPRRPGDHVRRATATAASSTAPNRPAPTCRSPARAASAAPAAPWSPTARPTCAATTRWNRRRSPRATS